MASSNELKENLALQRCRNYKCLDSLIAMDFFTYFNSVGNKCPLRICILNVRMYNEGHLPQLINKCDVIIAKTGIPVGCCINYLINLLIQ